MLAGLDSASAPTLAQAQAAAAAGVRVWPGYLDLPGYVFFGGAHGGDWEAFGFDNVRAAGMATFAFAFGAADPAVAAARAHWKGLDRLCLDVEAGQAGGYIGVHLDAYRRGGMAAGMYALWNDLASWRGRYDFAVGAAYTGGDPGQTHAPGFDLGVPMGWQWRGGHQEFGLNVDRAWYDDWFGGGEVLDETRLLGRGVYALCVELAQGRPATVAEMDAAQKQAEGTGGWEWVIEGAMGAAGARLAALTQQVSALAAKLAEGGAGGALPADVVEALHHIRAEVDALDAKSGGPA